MTEPNFRKWKERRVAQKEKEKKKDKAEYTSNKRTGRQVFEETNVKMDEDDEEGGDADILKFLKDKKAEEARLDKENAEMVEIMQKEMADLDKEGEKRVEEEIAQIQKQQKEDKEQEENEKKAAQENGTGSEENGEDVDEPHTDSSTPQPHLQGVDTALFADDENLPEFDEQ